jgi:predicted amidohydrolase
MSAVRVAIYQAQSGIDPAANAHRLVAAVREAAAGGAAMLFTPEMSGMLDRDRERALSKARDETEDEVLAAVRAAADEAGIWLHLGSLALRGDGGKLVNRGFVIDDGAEIRARYDKIHLFDVDLPTGESWRESAMYQAGREAVVVAGTPVGKLGLTIC